MNTLGKFSKSKLYYSELVDVINFLNKSVQVPFCVAGGALTNILINQKPNDYDIYFLNEDDFITSKRFLDNNPLVESESEMGKHGSSGYNGVYYTHRSSGYKLNIVRGFYGSPEHVISQFDLSICCLAVDRNLNVYTIPSMDLDKINRSMPLERTYVEFRHVHDVYATMGRATKYSKRGFKFRPRDLVGLSDHYENMLPYNESEVVVRQDLSKEKEDFNNALLKLFNSMSPNAHIELEAESLGYVNVFIKINSVSADSAALKEVVKTAKAYSDYTLTEAQPPFIVYDLRFDTHPDGPTEPDPTTLKPLPPIWDLPTPNSD
jgi:hypothetical protein